MSDAQFRFTSAADGLSIQTYAFQPAGTPRAVVVIAHGAAEHAQRYARFARALNAAGLAVYVPDHRGHGASCGPEGLGDFGAGGWDALVSDLAQLIDHVRGVHPGLPLALFAHSMGSFAAQQLCQNGAVGVDALVLSGSTAFEPPKPGETPPAWTPNAAFEPARTPYDWLSRDPAEVDKYVADPWCGFETQGERRRAARPRGLAALADPAALARIPARLPVLLVAGDADPLNRKLEGLHLLERRWRDAGVQRIDTRYYPGGRHEMLNETNRDEVTRDVIAWLDTVLG
jgi:alpha-beta hydrolase superfamily lysophospholipase